MPKNYKSTNIDDDIYTCPCCGEHDMDICGCSDSDQLKAHQEETEQMTKDAEKGVFD
jgi:hypothetical protein